MLVTFPVNILPTRKLRPRPTKAVTHCAGRSHERDRVPPKYIRDWSGSVRKEHVGRKESVRKVIESCKAFGREDMNSMIALHKSMVTDMGSFFDDSDNETPWTLKTEHIEPEPPKEPDFPVVDIFDAVDVDEDEDDDDSSLTFL